MYQCFSINWFVSGVAMHWINDFVVNPFGQVTQVFNPMFSLLLLLLLMLSFQSYSTLTLFISNDCAVHLYRYIEWSFTWRWIVVVNGKCRCESTIDSCLEFVHNWSSLQSGGIVLIADNYASKKNMVIWYGILSFFLPPIFVPHIRTLIWWHWNTIRRSE